MRRLKELIFITLIIMIPCKVMALEGTFEVSCPQAMPGEEVSCSIKGTSTDTVNKISADLSVVEGLEIVGFTASSDEWSSGELSASNNQISVSGNGTSENFNIGILKLKVSNTASAGTLALNFTNIKYYDTSGNANDIGNKQVDITVKSETLKKGLKSLSVEGYALGPLFSPETYDYTVVINSKTFKVNAVPANDNDAVIITNIEDPNAPLDANNITFVSHGGIMSIKIVVGDGGTGNEYTIAIQREAIEYDNSLSSLTVGGKRISLNSNQEIYEVYLDDVSSYEVNATVSDPDNFVIDSTNGGIGSYRGESNIIIIVKPKDSSLGLEGRTYTIVVKKNAGTSSGGSSSDITSNPQTGNISIFIITLILIASLIVSLHLYRKNMEYYQ